jgi:DNA invertase Pin-like site-specific DNA recombinase
LQGVAASSALGYVRVSVDHERKVSPEIQVEAIEKLCAAKGGELLHMEIERGRSAGTGRSGRAWITRGR